MINGMAGGDKIEELKAKTGAGSQLASIIPEPCHVLLCFHPPLQVFLGLKSSITGHHINNDFSKEK